MLQETIADHIKFQTVLYNDTQGLRQVPCKDMMSTTAVVSKDED